MAWLRANTAGSAVFATNRIHSGTALEGYSYVYSALSGRACFAEAVKAGVSNNTLPGEEVARRVAVLYGELFAGLPANEVQAACEREGIAYLVYSRLAADTWAEPQGLPVVFENNDVVIYSVAG